MPLLLALIVIVQVSDSSIYISTFIWRFQVWDLDYKTFYNSN